MSNQIITTIAFMLQTIAKENTYNITGIKFSPLVRGLQKNEDAAKDTKVDIYQRDKIKTHEERLRITVMGMRLIR